MKPVKILLLCILVISLISGSAFAAYRAGTTSSIDRGQWGAVQNLGVLEVPASKSASNCSGSASIVDSYGSNSSQAFSLYDRNAGKTVFQRNAKGVDEPMPLSNMVFPAGKYVLSIGGYPGSTANIGCEIKP